MILANFNKSLGYLSVSIFLTATGCSEQSPKHIALNEKANDAIAIQAESALFQPLSSQQSALRQSDFEDDELPEFETKTNEPQSNEEVVVKATAKAISTHAVAKHTKSLWTRMFSLYALPEIDNPRVEEELQNFLKHPKSLLTLQRRAQPYLYYILDELEAKKLPGELALLPMIESAFQVNARSQAAAAGLWQFTPATADTFGLKQNWWYDGRLDVVASTEAATRYLKQLNKKFNGNWLLALASYNVGPGRVQKELRKNTEQALQPDFWALDLPRETREYVPKLLAIAKLFAHAEKYHLPLHPIPNEPFLKTVHIDTQLDLTKAAELAGMPLDEFLHFNPAFNHAITGPHDSYKLLIKANKVASFKHKLAQLPKSERVKWQQYTVKPGEDLAAVAKLHGISVDTLIIINGLQTDKVAVGSILRIPPESVKALKVV
jgi:membrane-bound lytic murein transglycosylase D